MVYQGNGNHDFANVHYGGYIYNNINKLGKLFNVKFIRLVY
jgi:hypothetical protein